MGSISIVLIKKHYYEHYGHIKYSQQSSIAATKPQLLHITILQYLSPDKQSLRGFSNINCGKPSEKMTAFSVSAKLSAVHMPHTEVPLKKLIITDIQHCRNILRFQTRSSRPASSQAHCPRCAGRPFRQWNRNDCCYWVSTIHSSGGRPAAVDGFDTLHLMELLVTAGYWVQPTIACSRGGTGMSCAVHPILQCVAFAATWPCIASI